MAVRENRTPLRASELRRQIVLRDGPNCYLCGKEGLPLEVQQPRKRSIMYYFFVFDKQKCSKYLDYKYNFHMDHIVPVARGGSDDLENRAMACVNCNERKQESLNSEWSPSGNTRKSFRL